MTAPESQRFWRHVDKTASCWLWTASQTRNGYGVFSVTRSTRRFNIRAHRWAYENAVGPIGNLFVCHKCDTRNCVNPDHLFLGTAADNARDAASKNRMYRGGAGTPWTRRLTHCKRGHALDGANLSKYAKRRVCLPCMRFKQSQRKKEKP